MVATKIDRRGGRRAGAGRPSKSLAERTLTIAFSASPSLRDALKVKADKEGKCVSRVIGELLSASLRTPL